MSGKEGVPGESRDGSDRNMPVVMVPERKLPFAGGSSRSLHYMETVSDLLELHEIVDLLGRAANFGHQEKAGEDKQQVLSHKYFLFCVITGILSFCGLDGSFVHADKTRADEINT